MPQTAKLPEIVIMQTCPGCMRSLPFTLEHFAFCLLCGRTRDYIYMERITDQYKTSGLICEKYAMFLNHKEGRTRK